MEQQIINDQLMSEQIDQLATALAKAQGEFTTAGKNQKNPFFKSEYADFESVVYATRPALTKHGLSVIQSPFVLEDGNSYLITVLLHASGQWIKSKAKHNPIKADVQSLSSYNTYLKRMCYSSLLGVTTGEDDDGQSASHGYALNSQEIEYLVSLPDDLQAKICTHYKVNKIDDLTLDQYNKVVAQLKNKAQ